MKKEYKDLLFQDLCSRVPHCVYIVNITPGREDIKGTLLTISRYQPGSVHILTDFASGNQEFSPIEDVRPYLRTMQSMTEEEKEEYRSLCKKVSKRQFLATGRTAWTHEMNYRYVETSYEYYDTYESIDWLNAHHFDYRSLIKKGLAIKVTKKNNPYKEL